MAKASHASRDHGRKHPPDPTQAPDGLLRDADGLVVDEYSDPTIPHERASDALDDPTALVNDKVLDNVADGGDGIEEIDTIEGTSPRRNPDR